jgi:hypothetical protein
MRLALTLEAGASGKSLAVGVTIGQRHFDLSDSDQRAKCSRVESRQRRPSLLAAKHLESRSSHIIGIDGYRDRGASG